MYKRCRMSLPSVTQPQAVLFVSHSHSILETAASTIVSDDKWGSCECARAGPEEHECWTGHIIQVMPGPSILMYVV